MFIISGYRLDIDNLSDSDKLLNELDICSDFEDSVIDEIPNVKYVFIDVRKNVPLKKRNKQLLINILAQWKLKHKNMAIQNILLKVLMLKNVKLETTT